MKPVMSTVHDVIAAGYTLEPLTCLYCGSEETTYYQYISDAHCADCGEWQVREDKGRIKTRIKTRRMRAVYLIDNQDNIPACPDCKVQIGEGEDHCTNCALYECEIELEKWHRLGQYGLFAYEQIRLIYQDDHLSVVNRTAILRDEAHPEYPPDPAEDEWHRLTNEE